MNDDNPFNILRVCLKRKQESPVQEADKSGELKERIRGRLISSTDLFLL